METERESVGAKAYEKWNSNPEIRRVRVCFCFAKFDTTLLEVRGFDLGTIYANMIEFERIGLEGAFDLVLVLVLGREGVDLG